MARRAGIDINRTPWSVRIEGMQTEVSVYELGLDKLNGEMFGLVIYIQAWGRGSQGGEIMPELFSHKSLRLSRFNPGFEPGNLCRQTGNYI